MNTFAEDLKRADSRVHSVEKEWHYKCATEAGFVPATDSLFKTGLVREYTYNHPDGRVLRAASGAHSDHWSGIDVNGKESSGYWSTLNDWLNS